MIGIYVGAFNPVTIGHKKVSERAIKEFGLTKVIFVPVSSYYRKDNIASNKDRIEMLKLALKEEEKMTYSNIEQLSRRQFKTYETLRGLKQMQKEDLALIIGADNLFDLPNWANVTEILSEYTIIVLNRGNKPLNFIINSHPLLNKYKDNIRIVQDFEDEGISSTAIRENIDNEELIKDLIDKDVYKYIKKRNLYKL